MNVTTRPELVMISNMTDLVNKEHETDTTMILAISSSVLLVVLANAYVLYWIRNKNRTLVDTMIVLDCVANIGGMLGMFFTYPRRIWADPHYCTLMLVVRWFFIILNRVIPVTIAIYRYVMVCQGKDRFCFCLLRVETSRSV